MKREVQIRERVGFEKRKVMEVQIELLCKKTRRKLRK